LLERIESLHSLCAFKGLKRRLLYG
jgi:hypothetical protein